MSKLLWIIAGALLTVILCLLLSKQNKDLATALSVAACCLVLLGAMEYIEPVIRFVEQLQATGQLDSQMVKTLLKAVGITILTELAGGICQDSGNAAMGKAVGFLGTGVIVYLSLPFMQSLLDMIQKIMGEV